MAKVNGSSPSAMGKTSEKEGFLLAGFVDPIPVVKIWSRIHVRFGFVQWRDHRTLEGGPRLLDRATLTFKTIITSFRSLTPSRSDINGHSALRQLATII
jgi:hypothetical protein